jgi:hypothetical protein
MSKVITLGKVSITPKGRWDSSTQYERLDAVLYEGDLWIAKKDNINQQPSEETTFWKIALEGGGGGSEETNIVAFLPDKLYASPERTLEIYNSQVCPDADKYNFKWTCELGRSYGRKFSITPTQDQVGTYSLDLVITDSNGNTVWSKNATLYVNIMDFYGKAYLCAIGSRYTAGKVWIEEVNTMSQDKVRFRGSIGSVTNRYYEGRSGWTTETYLTKSEEYNSDTQEMEVNPFWDGSKFNYQYYLNQFTQTINYAQIFFGEEDMFLLDADTLAENILTIVESLDSQNRMKIFVVLPPCPGTQDGMAGVSDSEYEYFKGKCKYEINKMFIEGAKKIYDKVNSYPIYDTEIYFVPLTQCFDSENNFPTTEVAVNPRSAKTEIIQSDALEPTDDGYKQMADVMYFTYCSALKY